MMCFSCGRSIGQVDYSVGPHHCSCGWHQVDAEGGGWHDRYQWGDQAARVIQRMTGIRGCGGCKRRQQRLNQVGQFVGRALRSPGSE